MEPVERQQLMNAGQESFNAGDFFAAHEHWEAVWLATSGPERRWIQGLIQVATGLHKLTAGRGELCRGLLAKALAKLADAPASGCDGLDVARLRQAAAELAATLERGETADPRAVRVYRL